MQSVQFVPSQKSLFFSTLRGRVDAYFKERGLSIHANRQMVVKSWVLLACYLTPFVCFILGFPSGPAGLLLWAVMGIALAGIGMSIMHDAHHGAYSESAAVNRWMGYSLNLLGASIHNWKLQHNFLHHTYTNIVGLDHDIDDKGLFRFAPHSPPRYLHRFQFVYAFFVYGLTSLYWVVAKDFAQFFRYIRLKINRNKGKENFVVFVKIIVLKIVYFSTMLALPIALGASPAITLVGFFMMHFLAGLILTVVFQMAHTVEGTTHPIPDAQGNIDNDWAIHQMNTTVNFAPHNKWLSWYVGGLNFQVEHHLFTKICHIHYPAISSIVRQTAIEFGVPYLENKTLAQAFFAHISVLKRFGHWPSPAADLG